MTTATRTYREELAAARTAVNVAAKAVHTAKAQTVPLPTELVSELVARFGQERITATEAKVAAIAATIPALTAELQERIAVVEDLGQHACNRCDGTGIYRAPTSRRRNGQPYCFRCNGTGHAG